MEKSKYTKGDAVKYMGYPAKVEGAQQDISTGKFKYHVRYKKWFGGDKYVSIKANFVNENDIALD